MDRALDRVQRCPCHGPPSVVVLRGFDAGSRRRATKVGRRLRSRAEGVRVVTEPAPLVAELGATDEHHCAVVDATGRDAQVALTAWRWRANQPERGRLALAVDDHRETVLEPGQGLEVRARRGRLELSTIDDTAGGHLWAAAAVVEVRQVEGLHVLLRDDVLVADAPTSARIVLEDGVARRVR